LEARVKERLTGAIIVVALLVLLVPELLTGPEPRPSATPAGADGAQLRSYTIDLQGDASGQPPPPTAPATAVSEDPVAEATTDGAAASPEVADVSPPVDEATRAQGKPMGSGADSSAAATDESTPAESPKSAQASPPSAQDERPRSAFGPNARPQPASEASSANAGKPDAASSAAAKAAAAKAEAQRAEAAKAEAAKADAARTAAAKAEAAKAEAARAAAAKADAARAASAKAATAKSSASKGWAVQLGVFGSRDNAERLAKQVKGSGFPVLFNETSKDGKKLYWVRVGPEADQADAVALSAKLKAAGHRDARVVAYP
jgi:cell division septation protein DedD